ncbi:DNA-binding anti-repressor SinI [Jeotgalibacillus proteolyticus]
MGRAAEVDLEWVALINEALTAGISECEIEDFLKGKNLHRERERKKVAAG